MRENVDHVGGLAARLRGRPALQYVVLYILVKRRVAEHDRKKRLLQEEAQLSLQLLLETICHKVSFMRALALAGAAGLGRDLSVEKLVLPTPCAYFFGRVLPRV